jgi:putative transcriptional regulator
MGISVNIDVMMALRHISAGDLACRIGITPANLSILKNNKARAIRFSTLAALCRALNCQPGDLLQFDDDEEAPGEESSTGTPPTSSQQPNGDDNA